jgi:transcriptional regulator with XRE-family HTH domain
VTIYSLRDLRRYSGNAEKRTTTHVHEEDSMPVSGPTLVRRQLGRKLQRLREASGKTVLEIEAARIASRTKVWRIERGQVPVKVPDVWALCRFYGADQVETDALANLAIGTLEQGWWESYSDVIPEWFKLYVGIEATARHIRSFQETIMPGELQTADYARAIYRASQPDVDQDSLERHVNFRLQRQEGLLSRTPAPRVQVVLGQNVLTRQVGGNDTLQAQIEHLRRLDQRDHIEVRILRFDAGAHAAMDGAFRIFDFDDDEDPDVVYLEVLTGARYMEKAAEVAAYRRVFEMIYSQATPIEGFQP